MCWYSCLIELNCFTSIVRWKQIDKIVYDCFQSFWRTLSCTILCAIIIYITMISTWYPIVWNGFYSIRLNQIVSHDALFRTSLANCFCSYSDWNKSFVTHKDKALIFYSQWLWKLSLCSYYIPFISFNKETILYYRLFFLSVNIIIISIECIFLS